ncbi:transcriptional regulator [Cronobacter dublinensis subsp. dublinensis]|nr:transcriptional regulator [Cronobacter dublinensis subsp. dublinensis]EGT5729865.1 transcriptional regulator [Cronobacter dublinensis subsp. dublinensis]
MNHYSERESQTLISKMVDLGFRKVIICSSLGAPERLIDSLKKNSGKDDVCRGRLRNAVSLLAMRQEKIEATNFMTIYLRLAKDPEKVSDIKTVITAYEIYLNLHQTLRGRNYSDIMIDASAAYVLARDYRTEEIKMMTCNHCGNHFVASYDEKPYKCPFCDYGA